MLPYLIHWFGSFDLASSNQIYNFLKIFLEQIDRIKLIKKIKKKIFLTTRNHHFTNSFNYWFYTQSYGFLLFEAILRKCLKYNDNYTESYQLWNHSKILLKIVNPLKYLDLREKWDRNENPQKNEIFIHRGNHSKLYLTVSTAVYAKFDQIGTMAV